MNLIAAVSQVPRSPSFAGKKEISEQLLLIRDEASVIDHFFDLLPARPPCVGNLLSLELQIFERYIHLNCVEIIEAVRKVGRDMYKIRSGK